MRRLYSLAVIPAALLLVPGLVLAVPAQDPPSKASAKKTVPLSGMVSERGSALICAADQKTFHILNSETLKHLEGQLVTLKARFLAEKGQWYVAAVRVESNAPPSGVPRMEDASFRR